MKKQDLIKKLAEYGCTVEIDLEDGRNKTVRIRADGKNFSGNHEEITTWYSGKAADLYQEAFDKLKLASVGLQECSSDTCGSWCDEGGGYCEYWDV